MTCRAAVRLLPLLCLAAWLWGAPAQAQQGSLDSEDTLKNAFTFEKKSTFTRLLRGDDAMKKADVPLVKLAAKFYVQRVGWLSQQPDTKALRGYVSDFESNVVRYLTPDPKAPTDAKRQLFRTTLTEELIKSFKLVLKLDMKQWRAGVIHAALMLEPFGRTGQPEVGDFLAAQVKSGKHDLIKLFALKGLREFFHASPASVHEFTEDEYKDRPGEVGRLRLARWLEPVLDFLARPAPKGPEEEVAAHQFLRREAIKALAEAHIALVPLLKTKGNRAPVAYGLERVLVAGKDAFDPPTTLAERLEAALGLCRMKAEIDPRPQADLIVGLVGKTLLEFAQEYHNDQLLFSQKEPGKVPMLPWRAYAERLKLALKDLPTNLPAGKAKTGAQALDKAAAPILDLIRNHKALDETRIEPLKEAVRGLQRPPGNVYNGLKEPQIEVSQWPPGEG